MTKSKREGWYKGGKPTARAKADQIVALARNPVMPREKITLELGIGVASVVRIIIGSLAAERVERVLPS